jgi:RHS repeat-associated protein
MTVSGQPVVNYTYDDAGRLTTVSTSINGTVKNFNISYDNAGRRTALQMPLVEMGSGLYLTTNYTYDVANRLVEMLYQNPSATIEDILYGYDANGNRAAMTRTNAVLPSRDGVASAGYDEANEMLNFTPESSSAKNMTYDANGNLSSVTNSCGTTTYTWDVRNRLVGITGFKPDCSALSASFEYDAIGRRIGKTINGVTTQYLYDGMDIVQEIQGGSVTANYVRSLKIDEPLARIKDDGTARYYLTDALGSVIALTDENGNVMTTYTYDPFGNVTVSGEASDNPFQYTGREDDGTGLYYYRARYYSPELQRFISEDPMRLMAGVNFFAYVGNSSINLTDPLGLLGIGDAVGGLTEGFRHGIESGYYACFGKCMAGSLAAPFEAFTFKYMAETALSHYSFPLSRGFYTLRLPNPASLLDVKAYLKTLSPSLARNLKLFSKGLGYLGWGLLDYDIFDCIRKCVHCL